ncbi:pre-rRNA-processing protein esf1 [Coemansia spiralis]|uniref:Pre-rRNA-processing protein esf1 n=2 Tax=Coemansia TaxID=4863 RepID=A0A9W8G0P5_9FUNG|nr:pre-rRNA-processing protein esf1 [Coemansia umbellata]KAJ2618607.1 pre-rRNA-processing protein esf1 [Coemansia sp. RSA 1358]KAJ2668561.1 pre-rRNA-processing protein esf1 [Coemansia spiralis]
MAPQKGDGRPDVPVKKVTQDTRFSHVQEDPRFSRPKKALTKIKVDKRFAHMIKDKAFTESTKVDRYGRIKEDNRGETYLRNTYDFSGSEEGSSEEDSDEEADKATLKSEIRGSDESSESESEPGDDENAIDRARGRGIDSDESSDSEFDSEISDVEWSKFSGAPDGGLSDLEEDPDDIPRGDETRRFACVNMDWDNVRAVDMLAVFSAFTPEGGSVLSVKIYPSEFGKEQMAKEAVEGPPRELFAKTADGKQKSDSDSSDNSGSDLDSDPDSDDDKNNLIKEQVKGNEEVDQVALRRYEVQKLRYYFAVVECNSISTAKAICMQCDGTEYESSANFFDMRYIPDDMEFSDAPRDESMHVPEKYEPLDFVTQALRNSKVELSWDADEPSRTKITRRDFKQDEIDNMDFGNLLASASSSDNSSEDEDNLARKRNLLLMNAGKNSDEESDEDKMGDMEITFTPGLSEAASARLDADRALEDEAEGRANETTIERFRRVKKERRDRWKEMQKSKKSGKSKRVDDDNLISDSELDPKVAGDSFFTYSDAEHDAEPASGAASVMSKSNKKKGTRESKYERKQRIEAEAKERAQLELLLDGAEAGRKHFDISEIIKAEKNKGKKGKHGKKVDIQDDFKLNPSDPRFSALFESHSFAIDPNNPNFKKTKAMKDLLNESRKRRKHA